MYRGHKSCSPRVTMWGEGVYGGSLYHLCPSSTNLKFFQNLKCIKIKQVGVCLWKTSSGSWRKPLIRNFWKQEVGVEHHQSLTGPGFSSEVLLQSTFGFVSIFKAHGFASHGRGSAHTLIDAKSLWDALTLL